MITTQLSSDALPKGLTLCELLDYRARYQPNEVAYHYLKRGEFVDEQLTYAQLQRQAKLIAAHLQESIQKNNRRSTLQSDCQAGERALLLFPPGLEFVAAFLGCLYAGVTAVPAYPPRKNRSILRLQSIVDDADAAIVLTTSSLEAKVSQWFNKDSPLGRACWLATDTLMEKARQSNKCQSNSAVSLAFLQYTSGSTGQPKGVMVSQENLMHNLAAIYRCFEHSADSRGVIWLPPYHDMGLIGGVLQPLYGGFPVTLMSPVDFLQKPLRWIKAVSQYRATTSGGPNFAYDLCVHKLKRLLSQEEQPEILKNLDLSGWTVAFTGAEPIQASTLRRFSQAFSVYGFRPEAFYPCYGMAETTLIVSGGRVGRSPVIENFDTELLKQHRAKSIRREKLESSIGQPIAENQQTSTLIGCGHSLYDQSVVIVHPESRTRCQKGEIGEIWVAGKSVAEGYWRDYQQTQDAFHAYLSDTGDGPFFRTGDLGFIRSDEIGDELFVTGRIKDVLIIRGKNYYPQDIERTVGNSHTALRVGASGAFSIESTDGEKVVVVSEVERTHLRQLDTAEVKTSVRRAIASEYGLQVHEVVLMKPGSIPKTSSGKIQRYQCRDLFLSKGVKSL